MKWQQAILRVMSLLVGAVGVVVLAIYLMVMGIVPLLTLMSGVWWAWLLLLATIFITGCWWMLGPFSYRLFTVWVGLMLLLHGWVYFSSTIRTAFELDACLDQGGAWHDESCDLGDF